MERQKVWEGIQGPGALVVNCITAKSVKGEIVIHIRFRCLQFTEDLNEPEEIQRD